MKGDSQKLFRYGSGLANVLGIGNQEEHDRLYKLEGLMNLVKGVRMFDLLSRRDAEEAAWIFKKAFGANWKKGLALHSVLTLSRSDLLEGIAQSNESLKF